jgi:hypothetical protein
LEYEQDSGYSITMFENDAAGDLGNGEYLLKTYLAESLDFKCVYRLVGISIVQGYRYQQCGEYNAPFFLKKKKRTMF